MKKDRRKEEEISENWLKLVEAIPDIEQLILEDKIKVIRLKKGMKEPSDEDFYNKTVTLEELKAHEGNYGILVGYNNKKYGSSIAVADVDGLTIKQKHKLPMEQKAEIKQLTKEFIYNSLKEALPNALAVKTQSNGYHFYLWNEEEVNNFHEVSKNISFPSDFPVEELREQSLEHSIEIFTKQGSKYVVLPTSIITKLIVRKTNEKGKKIKKTIVLEEPREYTILNDVPINLEDVGTVNNIHEEVKEGLLANGYGVYERSSSRPNRKKSRSKTNGRKNSSKNTLKKLSEKEVAKVVDLLTAKYKVFEVIDGSKHYGALALGGYFEKHITKGSAERIASGIVKKVPSDLFNDSEAFKYDIIKNYIRDVEEKTGLPTLLDYIEDSDSNFNFEKFSEELNLICNRNFRKEKVATATINKIKVPVYLIETEFTKYLKYEGIVEGIDLTLDFNTLIGSFIYSRTGKEVDSFKFKFKNKFIEISKFKELKEFLEEEEIVLPDSFEKQLRRSVKSLDKSITKPKVIEESITKTVEEDLPEDVLIFGVTENSYYEQSAEKGIVFKKIYEKGITTEPIANVVINEVEIVLDSLGILEPVYNVTYYNKTFKKEVTVEYLTKKQLTEEFIKANVFYTSTKENVETVLNAFIIDGTKEGTIETKTEAYLQGYFYINNKVVENTKLKNLKYTKEDVAEAITLLNEIMKDRTEEGRRNDSSVYRFMLWNPFSYILKQLGYSKANYSLILIGKSQTNKTGATNIGRLFYNHVEEETSGSTVSVLGSKLGENTFLSVFDECSHLFKLPEALNVMKRLVYEFTARATKDRTDNTKIDVFNVLGLAMFILNEDEKFKDFITNRYKIIYYSGNSFISKTKINKFNEKYVPEAPNTILKKLAVIGKVFSEKLIAIIEDPTERKKLFNIEETTIEILKEIQQEAEVNFLPEMLETTTSSTKFNYDVVEAIKTYLNKEFKKRINKHDNYFIGSDFIQSAKNSNFNFLIYDSKKRKFLIKYSSFNKFVNEGLTDVHLDITEILEYLELKPTLEEEAKGTKFSYEDYIKKANRIGNKVHNGFYLDVEDLASKVFGIQLSEETD